MEFIAVNQNLRGKGIGKQLFSSLDDLASSKNASVWLETTKKNNNPLCILNNADFNIVDISIENGPVDILNGC